MPRPNSVSTPAATALESDGNKPVHEIRQRSIRAAIWRNETAKGPMYNVTVSRSYRDDSGNWHDTGSFGFDDLMNLAKALYDAHSHISVLRSNETTGPSQAGTRATRGNSTAR